MVSDVELLPSWRVGSTRREILDFLASVDEIPPDERVAVFDNDGTMWCEKPNYTQLEFWISELRLAIENDATIAQKPEFKAVLEHNMATIEKLGLETTATAFLDLFAGISAEAFNAKVAAFFVEQRHPGRGVPYRQQRYRRPGLLRTNSLVHSGPNEGVAKVPNIQRILGQRPVVAGGNSAGDAEREYAYESVAGTFESDETILQTADRLDWSVISMRDDWTTIFADDELN